MRSLIELLDDLHAPLIVIGLYFLGIFAMLGLGILFWIIFFAICDFLHYVVGMGRSESLFWTIYGVPIFAGILGLAWWGVRQLCITDRLVDYLEIGYEIKKTDNKIKSAAVKGVLSEAVEIKSTTVMNKIRRKF